MSDYYPEAEPLAGDVFFSDRALAEAGVLAERDPAALSDHQLRMIATYDRGGAQMYARRREVARLRAGLPPPAPRPAAAAVAKNAAGVTAREEALIKVICGALKKLQTKRDAQALETRITILETERSADRALIAELQATATKGGVPSVRWGGVHEAGATYRSGELVTRSGLWLCKAATTTATPGSDPDSWVLIVRAKSKDVE